MSAKVYTYICEQEKEVIKDWKASLRRIEIKLKGNFRQLKSLITWEKLTNDVNSEILFLCIKEKKWKLLSRWEKRHAQSHENNVVSVGDLLEVRQIVKGRLVLVKHVDNFAGKSNAFKSLSNSI